MLGRSRKPKVNPTWYWPGSESEYAGPLGTTDPPARVLSPSFAVGKELKQNTLMDDIAFKNGAVNHSSELFLHTPHPILGRFSPVDVAASGTKNWNTAVDAHGHIDRMSLSAAPRPSSLHLLPPNPSLANISEDSCRRIDFKHHHRMVLKVIGSHLQLDCNPRKVKSMHPSQAYIKKIQVVPKCTPCSITEKVLTADCGNAQHERKQRKWGYKSVCSVPTVKVPFPFPQNMFGEHVLSTLEIFPERTAVRAGETLSVEIQCQSLQKVCRIFVAVAVRNTYFYRRSICCGGRMRKEPIQVADHFYLQSSLMQEVNQKRTYSGIGPYQHGLFNVIGTKVNIVIPQDITSTQLRLVAPGLVAPPQSKRVMCRQTFELYVEALGNVTSGAPSAASSSSSSSVPCFRSIVTSVAALSLLPFQ